MSKRIIALICLFALLLGFVPGTATVANAATDQYKVGYSKKNINPIIQNNTTGDLGIPAQYTDENGNKQDYTDLADHYCEVDIHTTKDPNVTVKVPFVKIPLAGSGNEATRLATCLTDDNGDGLITTDDGLFVTATYVTDASGNAVVYLSADMIYSDITVLDEVRTRIVKAVQAEDSNSRIQPNQIMLTGSHSHSSLGVTTLNKAYTTWAEACSYSFGNRTPDTLYAAYWEYVVAQMTKAAVEAYNNRSAATMTKGAIDASEAMEDMGYTYTSGVRKGEGFLMNSIRHYNVKVVEKFLGVTSATYSYKVGDNFGRIPSGDTSGIDTTNVTVSHVREADDMLYLLQFERQGAEPVVLINWRAHASGNGNRRMLNVSSDYINALRYRLENNTAFGGEQNYCVGFWQGAAGSTNPSSEISEEYTFGATPEESVGYPSITLVDKNNQNIIKVPKLTEVESGSFYERYYASVGDEKFKYKDEFYRTALYGYLMGMIAEKCLTEKENGVLKHMTGNLDMGEIRVLSLTYVADTQTYSDGWAAAAEAWNAENTQSEVTQSEVEYPWVTTVDGTVYVINSDYHGKRVYDRTKDNGSNWTSTKPIYLNVVIMGKNVALVTGSGELFDHYDAAGSTDAASNDWLELNAVLGETYGTPFILSYTNDGTGYLPNSLAYDYQTVHNEDVPAGTISGSYEANVSNFAKGTGEKVIQLYKSMLEKITDEDAYYEKTCEACNKKVVWTPVYNMMKTTDYTTGHYYLAEDIDGVGSNSQMGIGAGSSHTQYQQDHTETVCIDLHGNSFYNSGRCFTIRRYSTLNIFDTIGGGEVVGTTADNNPEGGTYTTEKPSYVNLYGGTHTFRQIPGFKYNGTGRGGVMSLRGTLSIYEGARIEGADMVISTYYSSNNGYGGAVYAYSGSIINAYGGAITSGSVPEGGCGPCVFAAAMAVTFNISGKANIENVYYNAIGADSINVAGAYTGKLGLTINSGIINGRDFGNLPSGASISGAQIAFTNPSIVGIYTDGTNLKVKIPGTSDVAAVTTAGNTQTYTNLNSAAAAAGSGIVKLVADVTANVSLTNNANIDLAGHSITGTLTVANGKMVKFMDSATDDFDVSDGVYGKVKLTSANKSLIAPVTVDDELTEDGYLMITESSNASFHRIKLQITSMALRPAKAGLYYSSSFMGDQKIADLIAANGNDEVDFGVALSIKAHPNAENLGTKCQYSKFTDFKAGAGANDAASTSTLLVDIVSQERADFVNERYADMMVFGRAFVLLPDGQYVFGDIVARSLRQQVEATDAVWGKLNNSQRSGLLDLYNNYSFMSKWTVPNIKTANAEDDGVLKILEVGNSHGLDSTNLLAEVIQKETGKKVVIGALYYSGCRIDQHLDFMTNNEAVYNYYKNATFTEGVEGINGDGSWKITEDTTAKSALQDEDWDIITLQQMNHRSGMDKHYVLSDFNTVLNYIKENKKNPENEPIMMWHMVWTNPDDADLVATTKDANWISNHKNFYDDNGKYSMDILYDNIVRCTQKYIVGSGDYIGVIPAGTAIQYAKSVLGCTQKQLYRDYTHMNDYGRLIAAYVWYAKIFGLSKISDIQVTAIPSYLHHEDANYPADLQITPKMESDLIAAVNWALANPYSVG